ncbi:uncharacterized protein LOC114303787 [Camellia sinensis]|uniref:uncharacterized protein LOC114303787 n=1 Tax=Camellia sinensis TaxID=4442 RepID=UPI001036AEBD|nr:uncharacterized protein LOC114303787 [Camellia sinensis]
MEPITFTEVDCIGIRFPHDDPFVISALLSNYKVRRVLVNNSSSSDIIFLNVNRQPKVEEESLSPLQTPLVGFTGDRVTSMGSIDLSITIGEYLRQTTKLVTFLVVDYLSAYNIILGSTALNAFQAIISTYHLAMKFPTDLRVGTVRGEQTVAKECYVASLKEVKLKKAMIIKGLDVKDENELVRGEPVEELVEVPIDPFNPTKTAKIDANYPPKPKPTLQLSSSNTTMCLPGPIPTCRVDKLLEARFVKNVNYSRWLSNVVLVRKNNGKWRLCVDYSNLNRACPKDSYPLPRIDLLVDATVGHQMLSFIDAFSGYNQILMHPAD